MKSRFLTALSLAAVVGTGAAAAAVNTQVLWPRQDTVTLASDTQPASTQSATVDETPIPTATQAAQISNTVKAESHKARAHRAAASTTLSTTSSDSTDSQDATDVEVDDNSNDSASTEVETD
jgi:hypothetical protein